jgi:hypothetical protein
MAQTTVRMTEATHAALKELAQQERVSMQALLARLVEERRRRRILEGIGAAYLLLRQDERTWSAYQAELQGWDTTLADGLPAGEDWEVRRPRARKKRTRKQ